MTEGFHFANVSEFSKQKDQLEKSQLMGRLRKFICAFTRQRKIVIKKHMIKQPPPQWKKKNYRKLIVTIIIIITTIAIIIISDPLG